MKLFNKTIIILLMFLSINICYAEDPYSKALEGISKGYTTTAIEELSELLFEETDRAKLGRIYAILAITYTLENDDTKDKLQNLFFVIPEDMHNSIGAVFINFLKGKASSADLNKAVNKSDKNWRAAATIARYLSLLRNKPNINSLESIADEYKKLTANMDSDDWGSIWSSRIDKWQDWFEKKNKKKYGLEKYIVKDREINDETYEIETITEEEYADLRKIYKNRPKENSLDFSDSQMASYLATLPENLRELEKARFNTVSSIKQYLIRILERSPYPEGIKTKSRSMRGTIIMANKNYLVYKASRRSKKSKRAYWKDLKVEQYALMMEYYAKRRAKMSGAAHKTKEDMKKDAANDYFGAAILCDWFGDYQNALKYAKEVIRHNPAMKDTVSSMLLK